MYNGQVEKYVAAIFAFGAPTTINAGLTRYLAALGAAVTTTEQAVVIPRDGRLKNLYWNCEASGLTGSNHRATVFVNGVATTLEATWNGNLTSGNNITGNIAVSKGQRLAVRVQFASGGTTITRLRVSLELEADSEYPNRWDFDGANVFFMGTGNVGIGTDSPTEMLSVDGVVEASGGFKFPDGSVQMEAANPATGSPHSLDAADGNPIDAVFVANGGNVGIGIDPTDRFPQQKLTLTPDSNFVIEMPTPSGVAAASQAGGGLPADDYYFRVAASDGVGWTKASAQLVFNLTVNNGIRISWNPVLGATNYRVYRALTAGGTYKFIETPNPYYDYLSDAAFSATGSPPEVTTAYINKLSAAGNSWLLGGNVGIGTPDPQAKLEVKTDTAGSGLRLSGLDPGGEGAPLELWSAYSGGKVTGKMRSDANGANGGDFWIQVLDQASGILKDRLRIDYSGNVGIGTTNPIANLHVAGTFYAPGTIVQVVTSVLTTDLGPGANNDWSADLATLTITPKFANSKVIVRLNTFLDLQKINPEDPHSAAYVRIMVNTAKVAGGGVFFGNENPPDRTIPIVLVGEFSPGSISPVTFGIQLQQRNNGYSPTVARLYNSGNFGPSMFMAEEIAQ